MTLEHYLSTVCLSIQTKKQQHERQDHKSQNMLGIAMLVVFLCGDMDIRIEIMAVLPVIYIVWS